MSGRDITIPQPQSLMDESPIRLDGIIQDANFHESTIGTKTEFTAENSRILQPNFDQSEIFNEVLSALDTPKFQDEPEMTSTGNNNEIPFY
jgi:hypothetical protein